MSGDMKPAIESTAARNPCALPCRLRDIFQAFGKKKKVAGELLKSEVTDLVI